MQNIENPTRQHLEDRAFAYSRIFTNSHFQQKLSFQLKELLDKPNGWVNKCCELEATMQRVGISKLARIVEVFSRRLQNQERITTQVADALEKYLKPLGAAIIIEAKHECMGCRGVKKSHATMTTSAMRGVFFDKAEARSELMDLIKS